MLRFRDLRVMIEGKKLSPTLNGSPPVSQVVSQIDSSRKSKSVNYGKAELRSSNWQNS
jgi:hypothetical protein